MIKNYISKNKWLVQIYYIKMTNNKTLSNFLSYNLVNNRSDSLVTAMHIGTNFPCSSQAGG